MSYVSLCVCLSICLYICLYIFLCSQCTLNVQSVYTVIVQSVCTVSVQSVHLTVSLVPFPCPLPCPLPCPFSCPFPFPFLVPSLSLPFRSLAPLLVTPLTFSLSRKTPGFLHFLLLLSIPLSLLLSLSCHSLVTPFPSLVSHLVSPLVSTFSFTKEKCHTNR